MKAVLARVVGLRRQEREVRGHGLLRVAPRGRLRPGPRRTGALPRDPGQFTLSRQRYGSSGARGVSLPGPAAPHQARGSPDAPAPAVRAAPASVPGHTGSNHPWPVAFQRARPAVCRHRAATAWVTNITYLWMQERGLYLAVILDRAGPFGARNLAWRGSSLRSAGTNRATVYQTQMRSSSIHPAAQRTARRRPCRQGSSRAPRSWVSRRAAGQPLLVRSRGNPPDKGRVISVRGRLAATDPGAMGGPGSPWQRTRPVEISGKVGLAARERVRQASFRGDGIEKIDDSSPREYADLCRRCHGHRAESTGVVQYSAGLMAADRIGRADEHRHGSWASGPRHGGRGSETGRPRPGWPKRKRGISRPVHKANRQDASSSSGGHAPGRQGSCRIIPLVPNALSPSCLPPRRELRGS